MRYSAVAAVLAGLLSAAAQETQDKQELRAKFKQGDKLTLKIQQKMGLKLEQIPEEFQEMLGDEPFNMDFKGTVALEVGKVNDDGSAELKGKFKKMKVKGNAFVNEIDFDYDSDKGLPDDGGGEDPGGPFGMDPAAMLRQLATTELSLKVDAFGKIEITGGGGGQGAGMAAQLLNLNGLMGALPKEKVGAGDKWQSKDALSMPGMNQFKVSLKADNELEKFEDGGKVAVIKTKLSVGTVADEGEDPGGNMFNLKAKMTGEGEGKTRYNVEAGRTAHSQNKVKVKITATMDNPQGGDALEFKAVLSIEQEHTIE